MRFKQWIIERRKHILRWLLTKAGLTYGTLDTEQAIRDAYRKGVQATEKKYAERTYIWIDPTIRSYPQQQTDPLKSPEYVEKIRTQYEMPAVRPVWLDELVQQQEQIVMRHASPAREDAWLSDDDATVKRKAV